MQLFIHHCAQFEGDIWWNIQPMQFIMRDVHQILIELLCTGGDLGGGVQDLLRLGSHSSWRAHE